jgi:geranylgeranyl diphosphate synthase, type II
MIRNVHRAGSGEPFSIARFLAAESEMVEEALAELRATTAAQTPDSLREPLLYALETRGKRIRPILCAAAYEAVHRQHPAGGVYRLALALEVVHTYSLVHDDLPCMDDDDVRRGRPTVHRVHGVAAATLVGAALLPLAVRIVTDEAPRLGLHIARTARLVTELCAAAGAEGMVGGQLMDLEGEGRAISAAELESIHRAKTGALLTAALRIGGLAAGCDDAQLVSLTGYGQALGLAFQITDDILDVVGDSEALGKTAGRDEALNKSTYPALFGLDGARQLAQRRAEEGIDSLERRGLASPPLVALARYVVERSA